MSLDPADALSGGDVRSTRRTKPAFLCASALDVVRDHAARAVERMRGLQNSDGSFEGEVVWCPIILAQYVILCRILQRAIEASTRDRIVLHLELTRCADGGWGLHSESGSYIYVTTLVYVALRVLGVPPDAALVRQAREWLLSQPLGVLGIPSWGKFWLALIGLYDFRGVNPCPPELFLLPTWSPVHPDHLYCHTRYIYLAMCFLYGAKFQADLGSLAVVLRKELYRQPYETIDFAAHRHTIAATDLYAPPGRALRMAWNLMTLYERLLLRFEPLRALRRRALAHCLSRIKFEQRASRLQGLSPVSGILNTLVLAANDRNDPMIAPSVEGVESWRWDDAQNGMRLAGARSTSWDTAFGMLAVLAAPVPDGARGMLRDAYLFLAGAQEMGELIDGSSEARDAIRGGWCFSDGRHRWPVSDCAAEALTALLGTHATDIVDAQERMLPERLSAAAQFILDRQNPDGGFGTYERRRGYGWLEHLNPSEMFGNCMTESSYIECTASSLIALCRLRHLHPDCLRCQIDQAIERSCSFLRMQQRRDGSYPGFWGINFTYATSFAVMALRASGATGKDPTLLRAAAWLVDRQKVDGGWGEHYSGCLTDTYVEHPESQATMTSWALLALLDVLGAEAPAVQRGIEWLCRVQKRDGSWPEGAVNGVFFGAAMLTYRLYSTYFPIWALNRYLMIANDGTPD